VVEGEGGEMIKLITKDHEGKTILGVGTGNNAVRGGTTPPVNIHIIKVKRKYFTATIGGCSCLYDIDRKTGNDKESWNGGYSLYENEKDLKDTELADINMELIKSCLGGYGRVYMSLENTEKILKIIGIEGGDK